MPTYLMLLFELVGTVAFSVSGAIVALEKKMDIFGVIIMGLTTAIGGGVIRDLILGATPPNTFHDPVYAVTAILTAILVFLPPIRRRLSVHDLDNDHVLLYMDSLGLGVFTVIGIQAAHQAEVGGVFLHLFVGVVTGVGGGILRDMLAGNRPYVFIKHFYACASLLGAAACVILWPLFGELIAMTAGALVTIILRLLAAHFRWSLPRPK